MYENCISPVKKSSPLSQQPSLKVEVLPSPPFLKIRLEVQLPQAEREGVHTMCKLLTLTANRNKKS